MGMGFRVFLWFTIYFILEWFTCCYTPLIEHFQQLAMLCKWQYRSSVKRWKYCNGRISFPARVRDLLRQFHYQELVLRNNSKQFPTALTLQIQHCEWHFLCYLIGGTNLATLMAIKQLLGSMFYTSAIELHRKLRNEGLDHAYRNWLIYS